MTQHNIPIVTKHKASEEKEITILSFQLITKYLSIMKAEFYTS